MAWDKNSTARQISKVPPQKNPTAWDKNCTPRQTSKVPPQISKVPLQFFNSSILQFFNSSILQFFNSSILPRAGYVRVHVRVKSVVTA